ncbi:MAG: hypothetical protein HZB42_10035 [Sphingobacteriales bacterium]|nr:hypothetical protein [Sphingobacteriales bacterium]
MKKLLFVFIVMLGYSLTAPAQKMTVENVHKASARNAAAIKQGSDAKGYYFFFISDKIDKKTNEYTLRITDNTLKVLKDVKFQDSKHVYILESSFNGTDLIFLFYNDDENTFEYQVYGADGKKKHTYNRQLSKKDERFLKNTYLSADDEEETYKGLYPVEGNGFVSVMPSREDNDYTFQVDFFSTEKNKKWTYTPTEGGKKFIGDYLGYYKGVVYIEVLRFGGMFDQKPDSYILGLSIESGKKLFEKPTDSKFRFYPASLSLVNEGKAYIYGEYFDVDGNIMKDKSKGFAFWGVDEKGAIISEKYLSWDVEIAKYMDVTSKGRIADFGFMYLHQFVQTADGKIFAVGEGFKKTASALGILSTVLSNNGNRASVTKAKVTDMMILTFDQDFNIKGAKVWDKNSNSIELPGGFDFMSTPLLGKLLKYYFGGFDYAYTQVSNDFSSFSVYYSDFVKEKGSYKGGTFNSISYTDGKFTTDRINTKSDAKFSAIYPSSQGRVLIMDYYKKDKRLEMHIEKMN